MPLLHRLVRAAARRIFKGSRDRAADDLAIGVEHNSAPVSHPAFRAAPRLRHRRSRHWRALSSSVSQIALVTRLRYRRTSHGGLAYG